MAAPAKSSPQTSSSMNNSRKEPAAGDAAEEDNVKQPGTAVVNDKDATTEPAAITRRRIPSYEETKASDAYVSGKKLLDAGDFETALSVIEDGIQVLKEGEFVYPADCSEEEEEEHVLEESLAALQYLYGTTLLYSVEESNDDSQPATIEQNQESDDEGEEEDEDGHDGGANGDDEDEEEEQVAPEVEQDVLTAWECLEAARIALERLVTKATASAATEPQDCKIDQLKLDLAQVFVRLGDVHRLNGNYRNAIRDYTSCLSYRLGSALLQTFDRTLADVHYNLANACILFAADDKAKANTDDNSNDPQQDVDKNHLRARAFYHFLQAALLWTGHLVATLGTSNTDPHDFLTHTLPSHTITRQPSQELDSLTVDNTTASLAMQKLRLALTSSSDIVAPRDDESKQLLLSDIIDLLNEMQETIDEAETDEKGIQEVTEMKADITAAVAAAAAQTSSGLVAADGSTTTIGFGPTTTTSALAAATNNLHSTAQESQPQPNTILMVRKKKTKREDANDDAAKKRSHVSNE